MGDMCSNWATRSCMFTSSVPFADITSSGSSGPRAAGSPCHQNDSGPLSEKHLPRSSQREGRRGFKKQY